MFVNGVSVSIVILFGYLVYIFVIKFVVFRFVRCFIAFFSGRVSYASRMFLNLFLLCMKFVINIVELFVVDVFVFDWLFLLSVVSGVRASSIIGNCVLVLCFYDLVSVYILMSVCVFCVVLLC